VTAFTLVHNKSFQFLLCLVRTLDKNAAVARTKIDADALSEANEDDPSREQR